MNSTELESNKEQVGTNFNESDLESCQKKTWQLLYSLAEQIKPGMSETEAHLISKNIFSDFGVAKNWHPSKIRFGKNTLKTFRELSDPEVVLQDNDIFFLDLGPIFEGYEGDAGKTFILGKSEVASKVIHAGEEIFNHVKNKWTQTGATGAELYKYAENLAKEYGYELAGEGAYGHRISEFPHAVYHKGRLKDFESLPKPYRWILEIQLKDLANDIGAFYEDVLR